MTDTDKRATPAVQIARSRRNECPLCGIALKPGEVLRPRRNGPGPCHDACLTSNPDHDRATGEVIVDLLPTFVYAHNPTPMDFTVQDYRTVLSEARDYIRLLVGDQYSVVISHIDTLLSARSPKDRTPLFITGWDMVAGYTPPDKIFVNGLTYVPEPPPPADSLGGTIYYVLQDDLQNRLTPRVVDIAYSAFMLGASGKNKEDGGPCDWFTDTKPMVMEQIAKIRSALAASEGSTDA